jgi:hypothetical protein
MSRANEILVRYTSDLLSFEKCLQKAVEWQLKDAELNNHPQASLLLSKLGPILQSHTTALEEHLKHLGGGVTATLKETVTALTGMAAGFLDQFRTYPISKMLRDDYTALSLAAISYTMLYTTGLALRANSTADLAQSHLQDITPLIIEISEIIPFVLVHELAADAYYVDTAVAAEAMLKTHKTWKRENVEKADRPEKD